MKRTRQPVSKKKMGIIALALTASVFPLFARFTVSPNNGVSLAASSRTSSSSGVKEYVLEGYEHDRVMNMFSNPSDFKSAFNDYDGSKFNIGYVVGSNKFDKARMGSNDWVTPGECNVWFSVEPGEKIKLNVIYDNDNAHRAIACHAKNFNSYAVSNPSEIDGHGFEYFKTDIETGTTRINHGLSVIGRAAHSSHMTQCLYGVLDLEKIPSATDVDMSELVWFNQFLGHNGAVHDEIGDISNFEPFTIKIGVNQDIRDLGIKGHDLWWTYPRWNVLGKVPGDGEGQESFHKLEDNTTYWKELSGGKDHPIKKEGLIFTLVKDPASGHIGIYSGETQIKKPSINPLYVNKLEGTLPSEAVDLMFTGKMKLFKQESIQSFPGAIYGDSTYKIIIDDNKGKITIKYKPGSILHYGQVQDYTGKEYVWEFYGFGITKMNPLLNPKNDSIDVGKNYDPTNHIIDMFLTPSTVPEADIRKFVFKNVKDQVINPPSDFSANDIEVSYIPYDTQKRILITKITIKRIRISTSTGALADTYYDQEYPTKFYLWGFKNRPTTPSYVTFEDLREQVWLDGAQFNTIPEMLYKEIKSGSNQRVNQAIASSIQDSISFNPDYTWNFSKSSYRVTNLRVLSNAVDGRIKGSPQIEASIKVINLDSKYGTLVSLEMSLLVFNCPRILPNNLNNEIPEEVDVVDVNPQLSYMSKEDFESSGIFMLSEYLDNKYNSNRRNTSIPFAQISNIAVNAIPERPNSLEVTYDVTNYLEPNLNGKNSEFLLSNPKGVKIILNNFYSRSEVDDSTSNVTSEFVGKHNILINSSAVMSSQFATDFVSNPTNAAKVITDFALTGEPFIANFKNLPDDYRTVAKDPVVLLDSFVPDDINGTLTLTYALTYAMINGEKVKSDTGTKITATVTLSGFRSTKSVPPVNNQIIQVQQQSGDAQYEVLFRSWFRNWATNNLLKKTYISQVNKNKVEKFLQDDTYKLILVGLSFDPINNSATFLAKIPELSLLVPELGFEFSNGFNVIYKFRGKYLPNTVAVLNDGHINKTYDDFAKIVNTINYTSLIQVTGELPDKTTVNIKLNPYNADTHSAILEFKFSKFYTEEHMVEDHVESFDFSFVDDSFTDSGTILVDTLTKGQIESAVPVNPISPLTASQIVYEYKFSDAYQRQIRSFVNSEDFKRILFTSDIHPNGLLECTDIIQRDATSVEFIVSLGNGMRESVLMTGLDQAMASSVSVIPLLNRNITFDNIANTFKDLRPSEINEKAKEFIDLNSLPVGATIKDANVFNVGIDSHGDKVAYINFTINKFFVANNSGIVLYPNYIVQIKLNFSKTATYASITQTGFNVSSTVANSNSKTLTLVLAIALPLLLVISGGLITFVIIRKRKGGK